MPVLFEFEISEGEQKLFFSLDKPEYSGFPEDKEILLFDGFNAIVERVDTIEANGVKLTVINLRNKNKKKFKNSEKIKVLREEATVIEQ